MFYWVFSPKMKGDFEEGKWISDAMAKSVERPPPSLVGRGIRPIAWLNQ